MIRRPLIALLLLVSLAVAQEKDKPEKPKEQTPPVRVAVINVCTPGEPEQKELRSALEHLPAAPRFSSDFEISRGSTSMEGAASSRFVRIRREFPTDSPYLNAQYTISADDKNIIETLVLRLREPKDVSQISLEDQVTSGVATPTAVVAADTPATRIKLERFGKPSIALARCPEGDQSAYQPLFSQASGVLGKYRAALGLRTSYKGDVAWLSRPPAPAQKPPAKTPADKSSKPVPPKSK